MENFSNRLKEARKSKRITQEKIADILGVSKGAVGNWESGANTPKPDFLKALAAVLDVSENYLRGETENPSGKDDRIYEGALSPSQMTVDELKSVMKSRYEEWSDPGLPMDKKRFALGLIADIALELKNRIPRETRHGVNSVNQDPMVDKALGHASAAKKLAQELPQKHKAASPNENKPAPGHGADAHRK